MTTLINDSSTPLANLNLFDDPVPWNQVRIAGILVKATAVAFGGLKIDHNWKKQKSKDASGAVFSFNGSDPVGGESGFSITFRIVSRDEFAQLYEIWDAIKPVPVRGGGLPAKSTGSGYANAPQTTAVGSPATGSFDPEKALASAQAALAALNNPKPAASSVDAADEQTAATTPQPSPGPRPPTVPIELGWLAFLGVFACSLKTWEFPDIAQDKTQVTLTFVADKPPQPAGTGAQGAPKSAVGALTSSLATVTLTALNASLAAAAAGASGT